MGLFKKKTKVFEATLPDRQITMAADFNPGSSTWAFITAWVKKEIQEAREANDSLSKNMLETTAIRARIKTLKDILEIPKEKDPKRFRGLFEDDFPDSDIYAGY